MIHAPGPVLPKLEEELKHIEPGDPELAGQPKAAIRSYKIHFPDPDAEIDRCLTAVETRVVNVDAKLQEKRRHGGYSTVHYTNLKELRKSKTFMNRVRERFKPHEIVEAGERLLEKGPSALYAKGPVEKAIREAGGPGDDLDFTLGMYSDELLGRGGQYFPLQDTFLPSTNSPYAKQQLWFDYQNAHAKCWEAATKNPIAKRIVRIIPQFVLGRGVVGVTKGNSSAQKQWDQFYKDNKMKLRTKQIFKELLIYGEIFNRFFRQPGGKLAIRSVDPITIWDIITNPEDLEDVYYYHQQFTLAMNSPVVGNYQPATLVIRQIPADEIDHYKINSTFSEKRGRSELFAILSWLLRYKEFMNDRVIVNKVKSLFAMDVTVKGDQNEVNAARDQFSTPPGTASVFVHNDAVTMEFKPVNGNASDAIQDAEMLLKMIAIGAGVSENFLGVTKSQTRAGALISTEPDVKNFEDYQELVEDMLQSTWIRVRKRASVPDTTEMEFTFPTIAQEDRSNKLKDIQSAEAADYFSKKRAAEMTAHEFQLTTYSFESEQEQIRREREGDIMPVMPASLQQVPKITPDPIEQQMQMMDAENASIPHMSASMGFPEDIGGAGLPDTSATLNRPGFTRGSEKASIKGQKGTGSKSKGNSGTPLRHSAPPDQPKRRGWSPEARARGYAVRLAKSQERKRLNGQTDTPE